MAPDCNVLFWQESFKVYQMFVVAVGGLEKCILPTIQLIYWDELLICKNNLN